MSSLSPDKRMLEYDVTAPYSNILCFSTTRYGGCSKGNYASLNCTPYTGDNPEYVRQNRKLLCEAMSQPPRELVIPFQNHGTKIKVIDKAYAHATKSERTALLQGVDALMTKEPGFCICVSTADCIPVLLYDREHQAIAVAHAGWRGTVNRILKQTLEQMQQCYQTKGEEVIACIGPGISLPSFEVGDEVYENFREEGFPMDYISEWTPSTHKYHIDLWAANRMQLEDFGVPSAQIESAGICTFTRHEDFFSARRLGIKSGRMLSGIMLLE